MDHFSAQLLDWYDREGRKDLPWQHPRTAYRVWVSEIMLQQTQVSTVIPYFQNFMQRFPTLESLACADINQVLACWSGLGYYARARNLHAAARRVQEEFGGKFPHSVEDLQGLPGIGRSTAGAILAQAFDEPGVILDGNVRRVLCRFHGVEEDPLSAVGQKRLWQYAGQHTPDRRHADYAQAIMDLGATLCTRKPACQRCPVQTDCAAFQLGRQSEFPVRRKRLKRTQRVATMLLVLEGGRVFLEKRPPAGIWGGLYCPPMQFSDDLIEPCPGRSLGQRKHIFSHFDLLYEPVILEPENSSDVQDSPEGIWHRPGTALDVGVPQPVAVLLEELTGLMDRGP